MMHTRQRLFIPLTLLAAPVLAHAADIPVTTDLVAPVPDDGKCLLIEAIIAANNDMTVDACAKGEGTDTIQLQAIKYEVHTGYSGPQLFAQIIEDLVIKGTVSTATDPDTGEPVRSEIVRAADAPAISFFHVNNGKALTLTDLALTNGLSTNSNGGALTGFDENSLTLDNVVLQNNAAPKGDDDDEDGDDGQGGDNGSEADDTGSNSDDEQNDTPADTEAKKPTGDKTPGIDISAPKNPFGGSTAAPDTAPASAPSAEGSSNGGGCSLITNAHSQPRSRP